MYYTSLDKRIETKLSGNNEQLWTNSSEFFLYLQTQVKMEVEFKHPIRT